jgi:hypothetical protein
MNGMMQIGATSWINPDEVVGVGWNTYTDRMPEVYLRGGHTLAAPVFEAKPETDPTGAITRPITN